MTDATQTPPPEEPQAIENGSPEHEEICNLANAFSAMALVHGSKVVVAMSLYVAGELVHQTDDVANEALRRFEVMVRMNRESLRGVAERNAN